MARIGFIGLGNMGLPMASNLLKAGHAVTGFDLNPKAIEAFKDAGGTGAQTLEDITEGQDIIITMLQTGQQVHRVCLGETPLFKRLKPQTLFVDCSTIDVFEARTLHQFAEEHALLFIDAPVSGGVAGAGAGTLTFMVGGAAETYDKAEPILKTMGKTIIHAGGPGNGQAAKICNNMILGVSMIAVSEAFLMSESLGLTHEKLFEVVQHASGQCWVMDKYVPVPGLLDNVPANRAYQPGFATAMMLKDLQLSQQTAKKTHTQTPMGAKAAELYQQLLDSGMGEQDFSVIIKLLRENTTTG